MSNQESFQENDAIDEALSHVRVTDDAVSDYLRSLRKTPLLSAEEEVELSKRIEAWLVAEHRLSEVDDEHFIEELEWLVRDGKAAKNHMLEANLRLVVSVAKKYQHANSTMPFMDLIQEGNSGLIRAVEKFDYRKGFKFSTYATWWIRQSITRARADQSRVIRLPVHMVEVVNKIARFERNMTVSLGRTPTIEELSVELELPSEKILEIKEYARETASLDKPLGEDGEQTIGDILVDGDDNTTETAVGRRLLHDDLWKLLDTLSPREADIIAKRYGLGVGKPQTLDEIGAFYDLTRERIRQIEAKAMKTLKERLGTVALHEYLDL